MCCHCCAERLSGSFSWCIVVSAVPNMPPHCRYTTVPGWCPLTVHRSHVNPIVPQVAFSDWPLLIRFSPDNYTLQLPFLNSCIVKKRWSWGVPSATFPTKKEEDNIWLRWVLLFKRLQDNTLVNQIMWLFATAISHLSFQADVSFEEDTSSRCSSQFIRKLNSAQHCYSLSQCSNWYISAPSLNSMGLFVQSVMLMMPFLNALQSCRAWDIRVSKYIHD